MDSPLLPQGRGAARQITAAPAPLPRHSQTPLTPQASQPAEGRAAMVTSLVTPPVPPPPRSRLKLPTPSAKRTPGSQS